MSDINISHVLRILMLMLWTDYASGLRCWQCIANDCDADPDGNYKAVKKECLQGQYCQKVFFEMYSRIDRKKYFSTVRGCAWDCKERNDFTNCTGDLYSSRGCVQKSCCKNVDLCNQSSQRRTTTTYQFVSLVITTCLMCQYGFRIVS